jgi:signal transduction histidine kinase
MPTRVLMIDDRPQDRFLARRALVSEFPDLLMKEAGDAAGLEAALANCNADIIITDYELKWTNGLQVLAEIRARGIDAPVVMFTHTGSEEIAAAGLRAGLADYIIKSPTHYARLAHGIRVALQNAETARKEHEARIREREALRTAEEALRLKDDFLATLSHELRTPLNAISGWLQIMKSHPDPERLERGLSAIERNTVLLTRLIGDLVDVSRIVSGTLALHTQPVDMHRILDAALDSIRPAAQAKGVRIDAPARDRPELVTADLDRMQQVVWNLLTNAVKFTPSDGTITIKIERLDPMVQLTISDTGIGIRAEFLPHVFERFSQQDARITRQHGGMGLGLAIVRHLCEMHGGSVGVTSVEGRGSTFTVRIPAVAESDGSLVTPEARRREPTEAAVKGLSVLVIDDDPDSLDVIRNMLSDRGALVTVAHSAQEGYASLLRQVPDVLVCDVAMPGEDGLTFLTRLRRDKNRSIASVPAVAVTAYAQEKDRQRSLRAGFDAHLSKPLSSADLTTLVARFARPSAGSLPLTAR